MKMNRTPWKVLSRAAGVLVLLAAGCARVDTGADYDKVRQHVAEATGQTALYRPDEDDVAAARVAELMEGGLSLDDAVQVALLNNPTLQAAFMEIGMNRAEVVQSGLLANPSLGVALKFPSSGGLAMLEADLAQDIANIWRIPARKRAAEGELERAILSLARQAATLAADTKSAYYRAVGAGQILGIAKENLAIAGQLADLALVRQEAGAGDQLDVNLARGLVLEAELSVESARLAAAEARRTLARNLGLTDAPDDLSLTDSLPPAPGALAATDALVVTARNRRLDLLAAQQAASAAEARLREERLKVFPTLAVGVSLEREERRREGGRDLAADTARSSIAAGRLAAPEIEPRSARNDSQSVTIGPSFMLELPVFDQNQAQIAKAEFAYRQAAKTQEAVDRAALQEVRSAADQAATAWRVAGVYRDHLIPLAGNNLEL